jgi:hypothetical protein
VFQTPFSRRRRGPVTTQKPDGIQLHFEQPFRDGAAVSVRVRRSQPVSKSGVTITVDSCHCEKPKQEIDPDRAATLSQTAAVRNEGEKS